MRSPISLAHLSGRALLLTLCTAMLATPVAAQQTPAQGRAADGGKNHTGAQKGKPAVKKAPAKAAAAPVHDQFVDGIAAVVNKDVITLRDLNVGVLQARNELKGQGIALPDDESLKRQVLQRLIMERIQRQEADRLGIKITDAQVDIAIDGIAKRNKMGVDAMKTEVAKTGVTWDQYRDSLRTEIRQDRLRQRAVDANIVIGDSEVDAFLKEQDRLAATGGAGRPGSAPPAAPAPAGAEASPPPRSVPGPALLALAQILVRVPESASTSEVEQLKSKADGLLAKVRGGQDFAAVAAASSDGPEALEGGVIGGRAEDGWPDLFLKAVKGLQTGQLSAVVRSGQGFHILKVLDRRTAGQAAPKEAPRSPTAPGQVPPQAPAQGPGGQPDALKAPAGPMIVTQTHARHILIKVSAVMSDELAHQRLDQLRLRIVRGKEDFAELARQNSQDVSAPQGGDLGWISPGDTVPAFEQAMNALKPGEVSQPVQSPFGWHLIQVLERREHDVADEFKRMRARQILFERRAQPAFEDWLAQLRDQAYVDNRLTKQDAQQKNEQ
jgi:peptidyl-prolyl cis-trans isomerase SurA